MSPLDWSDPNCPISSHFIIREALWLPKWNRLAAAGDGLDTDSCTALLMLFQKMDVVRDFLDRPIHVHVAYRPKPYNLQIGGATDSCHIARRENGALLAAVDWDADQDCDQTRQVLLPHLEEWGLRMEDRPGSPWLHLDTRPVPEGHLRFFKP